MALVVVVLSLEVVKGQRGEKGRERVGLRTAMGAETAAANHSFFDSARGAI